MTKKGQQLFKKLSIILRKKRLKSEVKSSKLREKDQGQEAEIRDLINQTDPEIRSTKKMTGGTTGKATTEIKNAKKVK